MIQSKNIHLILFISSKINNQLLNHNNQFIKMQTNNTIQPTTLEDINTNQPIIPDQDKYDALLSSSDDDNPQNYKNKSPSNNNSQQKQYWTIKRNKINLHSLYPALSKSFHEEEQMKRQEKIDHHDVQESMRMSGGSGNATGRFEKYLSQQVKIALNQTPVNLAPKILGNQPPLLPREYSLRSSAESLLYRPEAYSLNSSRNYIPNSLSLGSPTIYEFSQMNSKQQIEKKLKFIFNYYAETYLQPTKKYQTFDVVGKRIMNFQSFILFTKDFKLLKNIFKLETIKKIFKKQSDFGKVLKFSNFINLIEILSHEKQSNLYFKLDETLPGMGPETKALLQTQSLYEYMGLSEDTTQIKQKFTKVFFPFNCQKQVELPKIKFNYRKLSLPDLYKKALPELKQSKSIKSRLTMKSSSQSNPSPFENQKQVLVSWQILRSKSLTSKDVVKHSTTKVKKLIKQDPEDKIYLNEYREAKSVSRKLVEQKIKELKKIQDKKNHRMIENLQRIDDKIMLSKLNLQKKLSKQKL